jgi:hypothetical protein
VTTVATSTDVFDLVHPGLSATNSFLVVIPGPQPSLGIALVSDHVLLYWSCSPGSQFQVEYRTDLFTGAWLNVGAPITATGSTCQYEGTLSGEQRFYHVVLLP